MNDDEWPESMGIATPYQPPLPEAQIFERTMQFLGEDGKPGTCFLYRREDWQYIVTADHLTTGERTEFVSLITWEGERREGRPLRRIGDLNRDFGDMAIFEVDELFDLMPGSRVPHTMTGLILGQEVLALGFPYGLVMRPMRKQPHPHLDDHFPMVKRGIAGGWDLHQPAPLIYLDAILNPGFSGGPVCHRNSVNGIMSIAGVVSGTLTQGESPDGSWPSHVAAGLSIATQIDVVDSIIASHSG